MVDFDVEQTIDLINNYDKPHRFEKYSNIYYNNTENIKDSQKYLNIQEGSTILTIAGSGDQALNAIYLGATDIDVFDINLLSKYFLDFKIATIKTLDYKSYIEFMFFFCIDVSLKCVKNSYRYIRKNLTNDGKIYWDSVLYLKKDKYSKKIYQRLIQYLCINFIDNEQLTTRCDFLANEENYNRLKSNLKKCHFRFYNAELFDLAKCIQNNYDVIYLSNIADYVIDGYTSLIKFKRYAEQELGKHLVGGGSLTISYIYNIGTSNGKFLNNSHIINLFFQEYEKYTFSGIYENQSDGILVLKR